MNQLAVVVSEPTLALIAGLIVFAAIAGFGAGCAHMRKKGLKP